LIGGSAEFRILNPRSASTCSRALRNVRIAMSHFDNRPAPRCRTRQQNSSCVFRCCAVRTKEQEKSDPLMVVTELPTRLFPLQRKRRYLTTSRRCEMASYVGGKVTPLPEDVPDNLGLADIDHFAQFCQEQKGTATRQRPGRKSGRTDWADIPGSGNYPRAYVVLHVEDNKMSRNSKSHA
jgi:hypothetical protein